MTVLSDAALESLRNRLSRCETWPCTYIFKFIVPQGSCARLAAVLDMLPTCERASRSGKYVSFTFERHMSCPEEVVMIYQKASTVEGVIAL